MMTENMKALHFKRKQGGFPQEFFDAVADMPGLDLEIVENWESMSEDELLEYIRGADILLASRAPRIPDEVAGSPGRLKYICYLHGTMCKVIGLPVIQSDIHVTNWGDRCGYGLAENSLTLLMVMLKDMPKRILAVRKGEGRGISSVGGELRGPRLGVYGFGFAGQEFVRLLAPFNAKIRIYDPYVQSVPDTCTRVDSLDDLFDGAQAVVIHAGLTEETQGSVSRELLAKLPDQGVVVNTARGAIIDQEALFDELRSGRLRAGLDVLWPDDLPVDHEARQWENLVWTCHEFGGRDWPGEKPDVQKKFGVFLDNIRSFLKGEPLKFEIDQIRYSRMT
ncbi:MAG: NAD(P)-dependent oxidoreductase [Verrucomicrobiota bacterium]